MKNEKLEAKYGLPAKVVFCKKCVMSNQRPSSTNEYMHRASTRHVTLELDKDGICSACRVNEAKDTNIDWEKREKELLKLLAQYRSKDGSYDVLVGGSGGKDSAFQSHILKYKYGMHPLTVTWSPHLYTDIGWTNFQNWLHVGGFDNYLFTPNPKIHRLLTKLATENLLHPFQPFILGQKTFALKMAAKFGIKLIMYGEMPGEYGTGISMNEAKFRSTNNDKEGYSLDYSFGKKIQDLYLGGMKISEILKKHKVTMGDLDPYIPMNLEAVKKHKIDCYYLGYYLKWVPQECYYYAVEHTGFKTNPERTEGTYSKYNSLDDRIDGFFYYTTFIKFGLGRTTYDASQEIRNQHLTRPEAAALVKKFDGEFPKKYFDEIMDYLSMKPQEFSQLCDKFRSPHLWKKVGKEWRLRHTVNQDGTDD